MVLYRISAHDIDSYAFREYPRLTTYQKIHQPILPIPPDGILLGRRCATCGHLLNKWEEPLDHLRAKKRKFDAGSTYDGVLMASRRFRKVYDENELTGLEFRTLPADPDFFAILPTRVIAYDIERRTPRLEKHCPDCGFYRNVIGPEPIYLKSDEIGAKEFIRTDLEFASGDEQSPLIICGEVAGEKLHKAKLRGLVVKMMKDGYI